MLFGVFGIILLLQFPLLIVGGVISYAVLSPARRKRFEKIAVACRAELKYYSEVDAGPMMQAAGFRKSDIGRVQDVPSFPLFIDRSHPGAILYISTYENFALTIGSRFQAEVLGIIYIPNYGFPEFSLEPRGILTSINQSVKHKVEGDLQQFPELKMKFVLWTQESNKVAQYLQSNFAAFFLAHPTWQFIFNGDVIFIVSTPYRIKERYCVPVFEAMRELLGLLRSQNRERFVEQPLCGDPNHPGANI